MHRKNTEVKAFTPDYWHFLLVSVFLIMAASLSEADARSLSVFDDIEYANLEVHIGFENEVSSQRLNYPIYILIAGNSWNVYNEQFRQLGELTDLWDQAQRGETLLDDSRNIPLPGTQYSRFQRQIRIVRADWEIIGQKCGYRSNGTPHSGCSYNKRLPKCTIIVPHQQNYADGDINEYHQLLGHEMWHCLVGSFH